MSLSFSLSRATRPRAVATLACGLAVGAVAGCHHGSSTFAEPSSADSTKVGYGEQFRGQTGGAVQSMTADQLAHLRVSQVEELLDGRVPGIHVIRTFSGGFLIRIRGVSTILGNPQPLYVIDGIPVQVDPERGLDWLSPSDIRRIDVLRGPPETSIYGGRGANGVILITTK
jgi:TonB-dependent SusC/RagA subfamily outer membrane receptor